VSASRTRRPAPEPSFAAPLRGSVLFVHGLWNTGVEAFLLRRRLASAGWRLRVLPYSSVSEQPDAIAHRCAREARRLADRTALPVHLLGHSLGGLILHRVFETGLLDADPRSGDFRRVVFLGSPAAGTRSAQALARWRHGRRLLGLCGAAELLDAPAREWHFTAELGVIAGNRPAGLGRLIAQFDEANDGTVSVEETRIPGARAHCVLPVNHTGLLFSDEVAREIVRFLETGTFGVRSRER